MWLVRWKKERMALIQAVACTCQVKLRHWCPQVVPSLVMEASPRQHLCDKQKRMREQKRETNSDKERQKDRFWSTG